MQLISNKIDTNPRYFNKKINLSHSYVDSVILKLDPN